MWATVVQLVRAGTDVAVVVYAGEEVKSGPVDCDVETESRGLVAASRIGSEVVVVTVGGSVATFRDTDDTTDSRLPVGTSRASRQLTVDVAATTASAATRRKHATLEV